MVLALSTYLDLQHSQPFDFRTWYNVTDPEEGYRKFWKGLGGFFFRLDYIFKKTETGTWEVQYKKASQINPFDPDKMPKNKHVPLVFLHNRTLSSNEVRISFYNAKDTKELWASWKKFAGDKSIPDFVYANVGAWYLKCNPLVVEDISSVTRVVWGTLMTTNISNCDVKMSKLKNILTLDKTLIPNMELGKRTRLEPEVDWVHFANVVNIMDVMRMFELLGWPKNERNVEFSLLCRVVGNTMKLLRKGIRVAPPDQGWKTPWKLPCRLKIS